MISFTEWLFGHVPNEVADGNIPNEDPVARLAQKYAGDRSWPIGMSSLEELRRHLFLLQMQRINISYYTDRAATCYAEGGVPGNFRASLMSAAEKVCDGVAEVAHVANLAWEDYQTFTKNQTN